MIDQALFKLNGITKTLVFLFIMAIFQGIFTILQAIYLATTITNLFHKEQLADQLLPMSLFFIFFIAKHIVIYFREKYMTHFSIKTGAALRKKLTTKLFHLGPNITATTGSGNMVTMALEGISNVEKYVQLFLPKLMNMMIVPILIFIYIFMLDGRSALILFLVLPVLIFFLILLGFAARTRADKQYESYQILSNHFVDSLRGLKTLRFLGLSKKYDRNIRKVSEQYRKATMNTLAIAFLSTFALEFFTSISIAIVALFLGLGLINSTLTLLPSLTILILAPEYFAPIREFGSDYHATLDGKNAFTAISAILEKPIYTQDQTKLPAWDEHASLKIKNMTVQVAGASAPLLDQVSFSIKGYQKIGIIGASGAGKSTLIHALSGFVNTNAEEIQINDQTIQSFANKDWQKQIYYIPQHPYIFHDTVRHNVAFYTKEATDEQIKRACERAGLTDVIESLPNGYDEMIGETGRSLSGGQEQRIALARAFLEDSRKILLFDEPTAHLDIETEWEIKQRMLPLLKERFVFFATHRLHWMKDMDWILVMHHGKIVEQGTHEELLEKQGYYYDLIDQQSHGTEA
ncbi:thiol reductant ABC exporter subunit CydD [Rummeliibacillus suwonensis]|uniref:thiol reductant ABC exporter subunit CydD n=1 Tax=Rummeliibacillus suwonensis TaxID=1306154 RepID=UPI0011B7943F|nr:thiol reductant ABC exporter subunit CydD [Rummeliibacillus suwonensis]MBO2536118.1 thiol reductant ABC exporter subunit CydD [Rummeliibacillus suwonensis]